MADSKKKSGLGSGLEAILGPDFSGFDDLSNEQVFSVSDSNEISLDKIYPNPYQPRKVFDEKELEQLAESIKEHGVFQPILVKPTDSGYILLAGERRVRAARLADLKTIPAIVKDFTDKELLELSLLENIQREDLSVIEEAQSYQKLIDELGYTQEELGKRLGKSRTHVTNILRLLNLPLDVQTMINKKELTMGQVRPLVSIDDQKEQIRLAKMIKNMDLSSRQVELLVKKMKDGNNKPISRVKDNIDPDLLSVQKSLQSHLATKVRIKPKEITIAYRDYNDLNRILEIIGIIE